MVYDSANAPTRAFPRLHAFHPCQHGAHPPRGQSGQMPVPGWTRAYFTRGHSSLELHGVAKALTPLTRGLKESARHSLRAEKHNSCGKCLKLIDTYRPCGLFVN